MTRRLFTRAPWRNHQAPPKVQRMPLIGIFADLIGLQTFTGTYECWMPTGFLIGLEGHEMPVEVIRRDFSFADFPRSNDPLEGEVFSVAGRYDPDRMAIHAVSVWNTETGEVLS